MTTPKEILAKSKDIIEQLTDQASTIFSLKEKNSSENLLSHRISKKKQLSIKHSITKCLSMLKQRQERNVIDEMALQVEIMEFNDNYCQPKFSLKEISSEMLAMNDINPTFQAKSEEIMKKQLNELQKEKKTNFNQSLGIFKNLK